MAGAEQTGSKDDLAIIEEIRAAHIAALKRGDARAWAAQFTEDGVQMPPNFPENSGRANIETWSQGFLGQFHDVDFALGVAEVRVSGDWAFESGSYTIDLAPKSGGPTLRDIGKYITVYRRTNGKDWHIARDIWNSNSAPPTMGS